MAETDLGSTMSMFNHKSATGVRLKKAQLELEAAKRRIASLEEELSRQDDGSLKPRAENPEACPEKKPPEFDAAPTPADASASEPDGATTEAEDGEPDAWTQLSRERDRYLLLAKQSQADLENYRRRVQKENATMKRDSLGRFLRDFLSAFDDLDRVITESEKDPAAATFRNGLRLARENLWRTLESQGVSAIAEAGGVFDPHFHEVIAAIPGGERAAGSILEVFQPGYRLDDFVLRPAKVVVAQS